MRKEENPYSRLFLLLAAASPPSSAPAPPSSFVEGPSATFAFLPCVHLEATRPRGRGQWALGEVWLGERATWPGEGSLGERLGLAGKGPSVCHGRA